MTTLSYIRIYIYTYIHTYIYSFMYVRTYIAKSRRKKYSLVAQFDLVHFRPIQTQYRLTRKQQ